MAYKVVSAKPVDHDLRTIVVGSSATEDRASGVNATIDAFSPC
jgi:hypothetical protein